MRIGGGGFGARVSKEVEAWGGRLFQRIAWMGKGLCF